MDIRKLITVDNDILGGQPVFTGTRVPVDSLFDHLEAGVSLHDFLDDFPSVSKEQVIALLNTANKLLTSKNVEQLYDAVAWRKPAKRLKQDFPEHEVFTVRDKGWNSMKNRELLKLMLAENFQVLLTFDKNLHHQQNFNKYTLTVLVLNAVINTYEVLTNLSEKVRKVSQQNPLPAVPIVITINESNT